MSNYQAVFKRYEKKYLITRVQYHFLVRTIGARFTRDRFAESTISNLYFDTPDHRIIRTSLGKPAYKEKLRLRCYCTPTDASEAFIEIKKKYAGVVYKRRVGMAYREAAGYLLHGASPAPNGQILREIDYFLSFYPGLAPAMFLSYDRLAVFCKENPELRITFDQNILWRKTALDLSAGVWGTPLLSPSACLMEIKIPNAAPVWLARALSEAGIFPVSWSKYGEAYRQWLAQAQQGGVICA